MSGIKCAGCGKFLGYAEMEPGGGAKHEFEPLSEFGPEVSDWIRRKCNEREQQENMRGSKGAIFLERIWYYLRRLVD